jgi:Fe-S oxidoreductase
MDFEVVHISQFLDQLMKEGKIKLGVKNPMRVTYHDPCNLGRLGEHYLPWKGVEKILPGPIVSFDPPKPERHGMQGEYESPRNLLRSIPGIQLVEMERIKGAAWCCGAGGGVIDSYPDFATWTARKRLEEAKSTGAEAIVTACPWCNRMFKDAVKESGINIKVFDVVELVNQAIES